jgi:hypothetical protein
MKIDVNASKECGDYHQGLDMKWHEADKLLLRYGYRNEPIRVKQAPIPISFHMWHTGQWTTEG